MDFLHDDILSKKNILEQISNIATQISTLTAQKSDDENITFSNEELENLLKDISLIQTKLEIKKEIHEKKSLPKPVEEFKIEEKIPKEKIPTPFLKMYKHILSSGIESKLIHDIMKLTLEQLPTSTNTTDAYARKYFEILLKKLIMTNSELKIIKNRQKVIVLVGEEGVGKTTALIKLASKFSTRSNEKYKVGIISLDTRKTHMTDTLLKHAKALRVSVENVCDINDFEVAFENLEYCDIILIDTLANSKNDNEKLITLDALLRFYSVGLDVNLVLDANEECEKLEQTYKNYSFLDIDNILFTKFDKTKKIGNIFSFIHKIKKPINYISNNKDSSKNIITATSYFLVSQILNERE